MKALSYLTGAIAYRWYGLAVAWVVCVVGWIAVAEVPDQYRADAKVYFDSESVMDPLLRGLTVSLDPTQEIAVMLKTLITRPTLEQVIRLTLPNANKLTAPELEEQVEKLQNSITITQLETKNYYQISFVDSDSATAASVAQALISILQNNKVGSTRLDMDDARSFISKKVAEYENRLREADKQREDFKTANLDVLGKANAGNRIDIASAAYDQATKDYNGAVARRDSVKSELDQTPKTVAADERMFLGSTVPIGPVVAAGAAAAPLMSTVQRLQQAEATLQDLRSKYTDNHPDVIATKRLIAELQSELATAPKQESDTPLQPVMIPNPVYVQLETKFSEEQANVAVQKERLASAAKDLDEAKREASHAIDVLTKYNELDRDYGNVEATYKQLLQSREAASLSQAKDDESQGISFRVLEPPQKPEFPFSPNRLIINTVVLLLGLGAGTGAMIGLMLNAARVISTDDLTAHFAIPIMGVVGRLRESATLRSRLGGISLVASVVMLLLTYGAVMAILQTSLHSVHLRSVLASLAAYLHSAAGARHV